ncbi:MAG: hypothetical protein AAFV25_09470 [Bacteroidota bacterium]
MNQQSMWRICFLFVTIALLGISCAEEPKPDQGCELIDIGQVGLECDSLRAIGENDKAAQLYFEAGEKNQSSELFVYAAWQFGEANQVDSALVAVKRAVAFGMNSPYVLDKVGIEEKSESSALRPELDKLLTEIERNNSSLDNFEVVTSPMSRFWTYFAQATQDTANAKQYLAKFICEGSDAIKDYYHIRYENVDRIHHVMIQKNVDYYRYLQSYFTDDKLEKVSQESKTMMQRFSELYPKAVFPKAYIVPDLINGSGTLTELGLYIGGDMFAKSDRMPVENLNDWQRSTINEFDNMKYHLVHELMHFQQSYSDFENRELLLGKMIEEGSCDFLVSLLTDDKKASPGVQRNLDYVAIPENKAFVMKELQRDLYSGDLSKWMHNGGAITDRPSDLGYTVGFLVCKSYYDNSSDKKAAIHTLLNTDDFKEIYRASEYSHIL